MVVLVFVELLVFVLIVLVMDVKLLLVVVVKFVVVLLVAVIVLVFEVLVVFVVVLRVVLVVLVLVVCVELMVDDMVVLVELVFVLLVSSFKEGYEDYERYRSDCVENQSEVIVCTYDRESDVIRETRKPSSKISNDVRSKST